MTAKDVNGCCSLYSYSFESEVAKRFIESRTDAGIDGTCNEELLISVLGDSSLRNFLNVPPSISSRELDVHPSFQ